MIQNLKVNQCRNASHLPLITAFTVEVERLQADEENLLEVVEPNSQEAIVSCLSLQWVNDLPGHFRVKPFRQPALTSNLI